MRYERISADCHIDLCQLPPDLFTSNASAALRDRMPYVTDSPKGKMWVSKNGGFFGLAGGMGSAGREYVPGQIHRSDRMASTGLYEDGKKGIYRLSDPELRLRTRTATACRPRCSTGSWAPPRGSTTPRPLSR